MLKLRVMKLLFEKIPQTKKFSDKIFVYGVWRSINDLLVGDL
jgi:hypothetical protein